MDLTNLIGVKPIAKTRKKIIYFNETTSLDISDPTIAFHVLAVGTTGTGKTYDAMIVMNQIPTGHFYDYKGDAYHVVLKEQGETKNWRFYEAKPFGHSTGKKIYRVNVNEIGLYGANAFKANSEKEAKLKRAMQKFFSLSPWNIHKNYKGFKTLLMEKTNGEELFEELSPLFDENDQGLSIQKLSMQKTIVDTHACTETRATGMILGSFFDARLRHPELRKTKLMIGVDETDTYAQSKDPVGRAMGFCFTFGRSFNISGLVAGTTEGRLDTKIKANATVYCFFPTPQDREKFLHKYQVDLDPLVFKYFEDTYGWKRGNFYLKANNFGISVPKPIHGDLFYQNFLEKKGVFSLNSSRFSENFLVRGLVGNS